MLLCTSLFDFLGFFLLCKWLCYPVSLVIYSIGFCPFSVSTSRFGLFAGYGFFSAGEIAVSKLAFDFML